MIPNIFWFIIAGIIVGGVAIIIAIATVNGVGLPAGQFTLLTWRNVGTIALVVLALLVLYFGILTPKWETPHPTDVGMWSSSHWFWLLILWGIIAALIALNACGAVAKTLQWVLAGVVVAVLVVFPLWELATSPSAPAHATSRPAEIPLVSWPRSSWPKLVIPKGEKVDISLPPGMHHVTVLGNDYRLYSRYQDGHECSSFGEETCPDGAVVDYSVENESEREEPNTVFYAFVRK